MIKRKTYKFRGGEIYEIEEHHDGKYGAPGVPRAKKKARTPEQIQKINNYNKAKRCRHKLLEYFDQNDIFLTWTYEPDQRPEDMAEAKADFARAMKKVRRAYKKAGTECRWIRNIERGTKGAWHIHMVISYMKGAADILTECWEKGSTYIARIRKNAKIYDEDFTKLANYMTKNQYSRPKKKDGSYGKSRLADASYQTSRNMPMKDPKVDKLVVWKKEPRAKKGYYISKIHEGINPITGFEYRRYTLVRLRI